MFNKRDFTIPKTGIDEIRELQIGGIKQTILIQSFNRNNPVLLFIHGGPSMPLPGVSSRGKDYTVATNTKELVKHYTVVFWDQRGTGKSYDKNIPKDSMNFQQFVKDANEMTDYLRSEFEKQKIYLVGHSFGTLVGMYLVHQYPEKFEHYIGISQIVNWVENDRLSLLWLKEKAKDKNDKKTMKKLEELGDPPYDESFKQWGIIRNLQMKYSSMVYSDENIKHPGLFKVTMGVLSSKEYSLKDFFNTFYHGFKLIYRDEFIKEIANIDVERDIKKINVPVTFIQGRKDVHVHAKPLENYIELLKTEKTKELIWVEKSSHLFHPDDTKIIESLLIKQLKNTNVS